MLIIVSIMDYLRKQIEEDFRSNRMTKNQDIANLLSFCIEQYKNAKHLSGGTAMEVLNG